MSGSEREKEEEGIWCVCRDRPVLTYIRQPRDGEFLAAIRWILTTGTLARVGGGVLDHEPDARHLVRDLSVVLEAGDWAE